MTAKIILALMVLLVPPKAQQARETEADATARYSVIAEAIAAEAGDDARLARFLVTVARHESSFRRDIHSGKKRGDGGRSWGLFQIMVSEHATQLLPRKARGTDGKLLRARDIAGTTPVATRNAAKAAAHYLRPIIEKCAGAPLCVFSAYGGVSKTRIAGDEKLRDRLAARVATYRRLAR